MLSGKKVQSAGKTSGDLKGDASGANVLANWGGPHTLEDFYGSRCKPFPVFLGQKICARVYVLYVRVRAHIFTNSIPILWT